VSWEARRCPYLALLSRSGLQRTAWVEATV